MEGVMFALSHSPEHFELVPGTRLRALKTAIYPRSPSLRIYFHISDDETVHLLAIELCDDVLPFIHYDES